MPLYNDVGYAIIIQDKESCSFLLKSFSKMLPIVQMKLNTCFKYFILFKINLLKKIFLTLEIQSWAAHQ